ncbi:hypothetical protein MFERI14822_00826 [Mycoplasma feriruminatoris]|uniref:Uncharacterized protein n=2 Tax=Mycoplasma feriruminatoris TaxID=1179777 RepID=A0AAX3TGJ7_9MOLU|nr:hypothetical protein MFERI14822_00826 [Mycoplasma feriruminatoris]
MKVSNKLIQLDFLNNADIKEIQREATIRLEYTFFVTENFSKIPIFKSYKCYCKKLKRYFALEAEMPQIEFWQLDILDNNQVKFEFVDLGYFCMSCLRLYWLWPHIDEFTIPNLNEISQDFEEKAKYATSYLNDNKPILYWKISE